MVAGLCFASMGAAMVSAKTELDRSLLQTAREALDFPEQWLSGEPRQLVLNGARVHILSGRSELSMSALLDHVQAGCREVGGGVPKLAKRAAKVLPNAPSGLLDGIVRAESSSEGVVACLQLGKAEMSLEQLAQRMGMFGETLDLNVLGGLRMVRVTPREHGSFFVVAMSEGSVPLARMFPEQGDAPGVDFPLLPRPADSTRLLSGWQVNGEPAINAYRVRRPVDDVWAQQLDLLGANGWTAAGTDHTTQSSREHAVLMWREGKSALVVAQPSDGETLLSLLPLDSGPGAIQVH